MPPIFDLGGIKINESYHISFQSILYFSDFSMASDFFSLLLEAGTDPNALDGKETPLLERLFQLLCNSEKSKRLFSYSTASEDVIRRNFTLLLHYKANPNTAKEGRDSLLFKAIEYEKEDLVEVLIEAGANISHFGNNKKTALDCCCHLKESEINAKNSSGTGLNFISNIKVYTIVYYFKE